MITSLSIENFALIEKLDIDFSNGFSIITGETGAGKSILLGALGLVLGKRADLASLKNKDEKCIVEANFSIGTYGLELFFESNELDYEADTIIRREILPSGKSRAFINDTPVNLQQLQDLSLFLIDVHSQHQTLELSEEDFQFKVLDSIANNKEHLRTFESTLKQFREANKDADLKRIEFNSLVKENEYNTFIYNELTSASLNRYELEELEQNYNALSNVESIKENLENLLQLANEDSFGLLKNLKDFKATLQKIVNFSKSYESLSERTNSVLIEFDDVVKEINREAELIFNDPKMLETLNNRLQLLYNLLKKHNVTTLDELIAVQTELESKVVSVTTLDREITDLDCRIQEYKTQLDTIANKITKSRREVIPFFSKNLIQILNDLGMPNVQFKIEISESDHYQKNGKDKLVFLFSANKGSDFGLLKKVASGGEMSRIMLAVKSILAEYSKLPTIIFDEIDTGVSGEIAIKISEIMNKMSNKMQVFSITHLPQIAAKGTYHFKVFKTILENKSLTELKLLSHEERVIEIAEMLSGKAVSDSAINHAKALLN
jgi:DNA repair protein RecN (Recombination protein N)